MTKSTFSSDSYTGQTKIITAVKHPPVVLNVVPSPVKSIQWFLSLTNVWCLADIDTYIEKTKMKHSKSSKSWGDHFTLLFLCTEIVGTLSDIWSNWLKCSSASKNIAVHLLPLQWACMLIGLFLKSSKGFAPRFLSVTKLYFNYHQNGHVAFAGTSPSRIWRVQVWCSSVPTLLNRLNAKSQDPCREIKIKKFMCWMNLKLYTKNLFFYEISNRLIPNNLSHIWCDMTAELTSHKCKIHGKPKTAAPGLACPAHSTQPNEIYTSGFPAARLQKQNTEQNGYN